MKIKRLIVAMLLMMCVVAGSEAREIKLSPTHQGQSQTDIILGGGLV